MKTTSKLAMIGALGILTSAVTFAQPAPGDDLLPPPGPQGRPGPDAPGPEAHRKALLEKFDGDRDGKLDNAEFAELGKAVFEGKLPPPPHGRVRPGFGPQERGGPDRPGFAPPRPREPRREGERDFGPPGAHPGGLDRPAFRPGPRGFGQPHSEEGKQVLERHRREFIKKYDANQDGKLDAAEREAIGKDIEDGKLPPPPLPPGARPETPAP